MSRLGLLALGAGLAGCAQSPEFQPPPPAVPAAWPQAPASNARLASEVGWQEFFADPALRELIAKALANNHDLRLAMSRVEEARASFGVASADRLPTVNVNLTQATSFTPPALTGTSKGTVARRADFTDSLVSYELDFWGRVSSLSEAARATLLASEASRRSVRLGLIAEVANGYFALLEANETLSLAKGIALNREMALEIVQRGKERGAASRLEVLQLEAAVEAARGEVVTLERVQGSLLNSLKFLVGDAAEPVAANAFLESQRLAVDYSTGLPAEVIVARPDVMAAEQRLRAANANVQAARAAFLPKILLTAGLGLASRSLLGLFDMGTRTWNFQPSLSMPVFDGGRTESNLDLAEARKVTAVVDYEKIIQTAFREVADLLVARASYVEQIRIAEATLQVQQERAWVVQARHKAGAASYYEVLEALREQLVAQRALVQVRRVRLAVAVQLYKALGGGERD